MADEQWFWCLKHGRAEPESQACRAEDRLGPYPSKEAAEHWRDRVDERNAAWAEQDREWAGDGDPTDR